MYLQIFFIILYFDSSSILSYMEIKLYKKRKSLVLNQAIEVTLHKRDDVVAILPIPFKEIPEDQKQLFLSIMKTITSQNPIIEEVSLDLGSKNMQLSYFFENVSKKPKGFISFFDKVILNDTKSIFIQAPEISNLMESQELKKVLWQKIKKDFID